jgi:DNA-directed RNA polymerase subunit RPC12/RpoP
MIPEHTYGNIKLYKCKRCEHTWATKAENTPTVCPRCHSPYWDKERRIEIKAGQNESNS